MDLDMCAFAIAPAAVKDPSATVDLAPINGTRPAEIAYWQKFNALHAWMRDLYYAKGGTDQDFNCNTVRLEAGDLDALAEALDHNLLAPIYPEDVTATRVFIDRARKRLAAGAIVYYDSWW